MEQGEFSSDDLLAGRCAGVRALENAFRDCEARLGRPATNVDVCEELGITLEDLYEHLERYRGLNLGRFDEIGSQAPDETSLSVRYVPFPRDEEISYIYPASEFRRGLTDAVNALPKNEQLVVYLRYRQKLSWAEIAASFGLSESRVAQIHTTAMLRIRPKLLDLHERTTGSATQIDQGCLCASPETETQQFEDYRLYQNIEMP